MNIPAHQTLSYLPKFSQLDIEKIPQQLSETFKKHLQQLEQILLDAKGHYTWENLIYPLDLMGDEWHKLIGPLGHLNSVKNTENVRKSYTACLPILAEYGLAFGQHKKLFEAVKALHDSPVYAELSSARKKIIDDYLLDFKLSGIDLNEMDRKTFESIQKKLSECSNRFENNLLDATQAWKKPITDENLLSGLPEHSKNAAAKLAKEQNITGWILTLEPPSYHAIMTYADNRTLREEAYRHYVTRASALSPSGKTWDNSLVMEDILKLRDQEAKLLGYANYAELSLVKKTAKIPSKVFDFLNDLVKKARKQAEEEYARLQDFAAKQYHIEKLEPWDIAYVSEKLFEATYAISEEMLRPYFPHSVVLEGLFTIAGKLYGIRFEPVTGVDTWDPHVQFYQVYDETHQLRGQVYIDLYARLQKRGGAWMDNCLNKICLDRASPDGWQTPTAYLNCNFPAPIDKDKPSLLSHTEVITLFHEFGHVLHHILTRVEDASAAGIEGVEWDAVEFPSQFFENWCWHAESLNLISKHIDTQKPISEAIIKKMLDAKNFNSAMYLLRQLELSLFDFHIHAEYDPEQTNQIQQTLDDIRRNISVTPIASYNRFQHGFSHIFAGGYGAGYYSYLWSEVLSSDAFASFEENGLFDKTTGRKFLHEVLEVGSSRPAMDSFLAFRGKPPSIDSLLKHLGIHV